MDNLCHTLVGAALAESGLKRRTPLATATLLIGANLPDLDAFAYAWGNLAALEFRRGWTHGVLAMAVLPVALAGGMVAWDVLVRRRSGVSKLRQPAMFGQLLLLSFIAVWSHPLLDLLNTYGVRLLMPFSGRWFHGDALFIIDLWVWLALGLGVWLSRRAARRHAPPSAIVFPARLALAGVVVYATAMSIVSWRTRSNLQEQLARAGSEARVLMAAPIPLNPAKRELVVLQGQEYRRGIARAWDAAGWASSDAVPVRGAGAAGDLAAESELGQRFLGWSRLPFFGPVPEGSADPAAVRISDFRYARPGADSWASVVVRLPGR